MSCHRHLFPNLVYVKACNRTYNSALTSPSPLCIPERARDNRQPIFVTWDYRYRLLLPSFSIGKGREDERGWKNVAAVEKIRFSNYVLPFLPLLSSRWRDGTFCGRERDADDARTVGRREREVGKKLSSRREFRFPPAFPSASVSPPPAAPSLSLCPLLSPLFAPQSS